MNSNKFMNVHVFDGKIGKGYKRQHTLISTELWLKIANFYEKLTNPIAKQTVKMIMVDRNQNYDPRNDIDASDILADIIIKISDDEVVDGYIQEQIADIFLLGRCPQGRTTRLYQIWRALYNIT